MTSPSAGRREKTLYGSDHGKLNITLPAPTMWMNMGFWKVGDSLDITLHSLADGKRIPKTSQPRVKLYWKKYLSVPGSCGTMVQEWTMSHQRP
jgi:hypothetical protein